MRIGAAGAGTPCLLETVDGAGHDRATRELGH
jgi:hypothetical protein